MGVKAAILRRLHVAPPWRANTRERLADWICLFVAERGSAEPTTVWRQSPPSLNKPDY